MIDDTKPKADSDVELTEKEPLPFNSSDPYAMKWSEQALDLIKSKKLAVTLGEMGGIRFAKIDGACPYCGDAIHQVQALTAISEGADATLGRLERTATLTLDLPSRSKEPREPQYEDVTVTCGCGIIHPGSPKDATGCGTRFRVSVRRSR